MDVAVMGIYFLHSSNRVFTKRISSRYDMLQYNTNAQQLFFLVLPKISVYNAMWYKFSCYYISLYKFVLTSFLIHTVMAFNPKTWKEIPKMVCERRKYAKQRR
jgi:hypothetical protein